MYKLHAICAVLLIFTAHLVSAQPITVTTSPTSKLAIHPKQEVPATVVSINDSVISSELHARLVSFPFKVGDHVKKGEVLAHLYCEDKQLNAEQMKAQIEGTIAQQNLAKWQLKRSKSLAKAQNVSTESVKNLEAQLLISNAQLRSQQASLRLANIQIEKCKIKAPFSGVITTRHSSLGEMLAPGAPLLKMIDQSRLELKAYLHVDEVASIPGATLYFEYEQHSYPVKIRSFVDAIDQTTRTQEIRLQFQKDCTLPGAAGRLVWYSIDPHLPASVLTQVGERFGIYIAKENKAHFVPFEHAIEGRPIAITKDFNEEIIIDGRYIVNDQSQIKLDTEQKI